MKTTLNRGCDAVSGFAEATPPRIHSARGTVVGVNAKAGTLVLAVCCERQEFAVRHWTRVRIDSSNVAAADIPTGTTARTSYPPASGRAITL